MWIPITTNFRVATQLALPSKCFHVLISFILLIILSMYSFQTFLLSFSLPDSACSPQSHFYTFPYAHPSFLLLLPSRPGSTTMCPPDLSSLSSSIILHHMPLTLFFKSFPQVWCISAYQLSYSSFKSFPCMVFLPLPNLPSFNRFLSHHLLHLLLNQMQDHQPVCAEAHLG